MHAATDRLEFAPQPTPGLLRALTLAVLAHAFLLAALTWGVHWKREAVTVTAEAELWSVVPQQTAPKLVEEPLPEPPKTPEPLKAPPPEPPQAQPKLPDADIALEREKLRLKKEKEKQQELQKRQELEKQRLEKQRLEKLKQEKLQLEKKRQLDKKAAEDKKKSDQDSKHKEALQAQQEGKRVEAEHQKRMNQLQGMAGAGGSPGSTGTAQRSTGPSVSYSQRLAALFKDNVVFPNRESISGNPIATVEVQVSASGLIMSSRLITSSGVPRWDTAALRAVEKTERIPADENGNFLRVFPVYLRPKD